MLEYYAAVSAAGLTAQLFLPRQRGFAALPGGQLPAAPDGCAAQVTVLAGDGEAQTLAAALSGLNAALILVEGIDWAADLSPWPAPRAFRGGEDFTGGADAFLERLCGSLLPKAERLLEAACTGLPPAVQPSGAAMARGGTGEAACARQLQAAGQPAAVPAAPRRVLAGYSLAGLCSLYAFYRTDWFDGAACVSGSLWYDGFADYMAARRPIKIPDRVYFSLGLREPKARAARLAAVGHCTEQAARLLAGLGCETVLEWNPGGHFDDPEGRLARGVLWAAERT